MCRVLLMVQASHGTGIAVYDPEVNQILSPAAGARQAVEQGERELAGLLEVHAFSGADHLVAALLTRLGDELLSAGEVDWCERFLGAAQSMCADDDEANELRARLFAAKRAAGPVSH